MNAIKALLALSFFVFGVAGCGEKDPDPSSQIEKITLAVTPWPASAPLYVAHEKGYFQDEGLDTTIRSYISGHLGLGAVISGEVDFATVGETPIAQAAVDGKQIAVVATISRIERAILVIARKDRGISKPEDLKGKRIGVVAGTTADFFLYLYLATSHIDPKEARIVNLPTEEIVGALIKGEVDAVSTWAPHTTILRDKLGGNATILHDPSIYTMTWNIVARPDTLKSRPERVQKLLRAVVRANTFITEHTAEAHAISARSLGTNTSLYEREWNDYAFEASLDQSLILNLEDQARWLIKREGDNERRTPNFTNFIHVDGLKAVQPEAVRMVGK